MLVSSPLKGIEKLSEDLKCERQKANTALQERARLRVEVESLKQTLVNYEQSHGTWKEEKQQLQLENQELFNTLDEAKQTSATLQEHILEKALEIKQINFELSNRQTEFTKLYDTISEKDELIMSSKLQIESKENEISSKEKQIQKLREELEYSRVELENSDRRFTELSKEITQKQLMENDMQNKLRATSVFEYNYLQSKQSNEALRSELETLLESNAKMSQQLREISNKYAEKVHREHSFEQQLLDLTAERDVLQKESADWEMTREELSNRAQAEMAAAEAARERAEAASRGRDLLESQLQELRRLREESTDYTHGLEEEVSQSRSQLSALQQELQQTRQQLSILQDEATGQGGGRYDEVDTLRAQLLDVRKQLMKREVEGEALGAMQSRNTFEREAHGRQVYESIIEELRAENSRTISQYLEATRRMEELQLQSIRVTQLEEEVQMYREMATSVSLESHSAALSASEAVDRSLQVSHANRHAMQELQRKEATLETTKNENRRLQEEAQSQRDKMKELHLLKLAADRKTAETLTANSKLETFMEELRQKLEVSNMELNKAQRDASQLINLFNPNRTSTLSDLHSLKQHQHTVTELKQKLQQSEKDKNALFLSSSSQNALALSSSSSSSFCSSTLKLNVSRRESELLHDLQILQEGRTDMQKELELLKGRLETEKKHVSDAHAEVDKLRSQLETTTDDLLRCRKELNQQEKMAADQHLQDLKRDLEATLEDWRRSEQERDAKDKVNSQLQTELLKEREKYTVLKMQNSSLEDRVRVAHQELQVYKSIDVYHSSMKVELESLREEKRGFTPASKYRASATKSIDGSSNPNLPNRESKSKTIDPNHHGTNPNPNPTSDMYDGSQHDLGSGHSRSRDEQQRFNDNFLILSPDLHDGGGRLTLADIHSIDGRETSKSSNAEADISRETNSSKLFNRTPQYPVYKTQEVIYTEDMSQQSHHRSNSNSNVSAARKGNNSFVTVSSSNNNSNSSSDGRKHLSSSSTAAVGKGEVVSRPYQPETATHANVSRPIYLHSKPVSGNNSVSSSNTTAPSESSFVTLTQHHPSRSTTTSKINNTNNSNSDSNHNHTTTPHQNNSVHDGSKNTRSSSNDSSADANSRSGVGGHGNDDSSSSSSSSSTSGRRAQQPTIYRPSKADFERARRLLAK